MQYVRRKNGPSALKQTKITKKSFIQDTYIPFLSTFIWVSFIKKQCFEQIRVFVNRIQNDDRRSIILG